MSRVWFCLLAAVAGALTTPVAWAGEERFYERGFKPYETTLTAAAGLKGFYTQPDDLVELRAGERVFVFTRAKAPHANRVWVKVRTTHHYGWVPEANLAGSMVEEYVDNEGTWLYPGIDECRSLLVSLDRQQDHEEPGYPKHTTTLRGETKMRDWYLQPLPARRLGPRAKLEVFARSLCTKDNKRWVKVKTLHIWGWIPQQALARARPGGPPIPADREVVGAPAAAPAPAETAGALSGSFTPYKTKTTKRVAASEEIGGDEVAELAQGDDVTVLEVTAFGGKKWARVKQPLYTISLWIPVSALMQSPPKPDLNAIAHRVFSRLAQSGGTWRTLVGTSKEALAADRSQAAALSNTLRQIATAVTQAMKASARDLRNLSPAERAVVKRMVAVKEVAYRALHTDQNRLVWRKGRLNGRTVRESRWDCTNSTVAIWAQAAFVSGQHQSARLRNPGCRTWKKRKGKRNKAKKYCVRRFEYLVPRFQPQHAKEWSLFAFAEGVVSPHVANMTWSHETFGADERRFKTSRIAPAKVAARAHCEPGRGRSGRCPSAIRWIHPGKDFRNVRVGQVIVWRQYKSLGAGHVGTIVHVDHQRSFLIVAETVKEWWERLQKWSTPRAPKWKPFKLNFIYWGKYAEDIRFSRKAPGGGDIHAFVRRSLLASLPVFGKHPSWFRSEVCNWRLESERRAVERIRGCDFIGFGGGQAIGEIIENW